MKLIDKWEVVQIRIAVFHVLLGSVPQLWLAWQLLNKADILDRITFHPGIMLLILCVPGLVWKRITLRLACWGMSKQDIEINSETWTDNEPMLFWLPLFQMQSGMFFLFKMAFITFVRLFKKDFRSEKIYLINEPISH